MSQSSPDVATGDRNRDDLQAALEHRERQVDAIRRITNALFSQPLIEDMLRETLTVSIEVLEADVGSLQLHDPETDTLVFRYVMDPQAEHLIGHSYPASQGIGGRVFGSGEAQLINKVSERADFNRSVDELTGYHTESMLTVPLKRFGGQPIGIVQILNAQRAFDRHDLEVLEVLSAQAAAAIETARLTQEAKRAEIVNVLGDISHDIKNMLTPIQSGIMMLLPTLRETFADLEKLCANSTDHQAWTHEQWSAAIEQATSFAREDYDWVLENALDSADKMQARTKEIADAIKGELAPPVFETGDINETLRSVARTLRMVAEDAGLNLRFELDPELPLAQFDSKQMYNALYNLVYNAIPETPSGGSITLRTRAPQANDKTLLIEIADTGRGIPAHVREKLFTNQAVSTKAGGTGLGTRIVAGVVQRHHATIEVQSEEGRGSTFSIRLPLHQKDA